MSRAQISQVIRGKARVGLHREGLSKTRPFCGRMRSRILFSEGGGEGGTDVGRHVGFVGNLEGPEPAWLEMASVSHRCFRDAGKNTSLNREPI